MGPHPCQNSHGLAWPACLGLAACLLLLPGCPPYADVAASSWSRSETGDVSGGRSREIRRLPPDEREAGRVFAAVNLERMRHGLTMLTRSRDLDAVAYRHALDLVAMGRLSHSSSDGRQLEHRLAHLNWVWASENLARNKGFENPTAEAVSGWLMSPRHRVNMLRPDVSQTGIAVVRDPNSRFTYIAQMFMIP